MKPQIRHRWSFSLLLIIVLVASVPGATGMGLPLAAAGFLC